MFATVLVCSQLPDAEQRISTLLGPRMEFEDGYSTEGDLGIKEMTFSLNASTSELARADFDGVPKTIDKQQRTTSFFCTTKLSRPHWRDLQPSKSHCNVSRRRTPWEDSAGLDQRLGLLQIRASPKGCEAGEDAQTCKCCYFHLHVDHSHPYGTCQTASETVNKFDVKSLRVSST